MRLAMQDHRVDRAADIVDRGVADDLDRAGLGVDLDLADLRAVGEAGDRKRLVRDRGERPPQIRRQDPCVRPRRCDLEEADCPVGAGDPKARRRANSMSISPVSSRKLAILRPLSMMASVASPMIVAASFIERPECEPPPAATRAVSWAT